MARSIPRSTEDPFAALAGRSGALSVAEMASYLQVSPKTARALIKSGDVAAERTAQGYRIEPALLLRYLRSKCQPRFFVVK